MIIYKDRVCGDELFSDTYPVKLVHEGFFYEVKGKHETRKENLDGVNIGANASEDNPDEECDAGSSSGINVCLDNRLTATAFKNKKEFVKTTLSPYLKRVKDLLIAEGEEDRAAKFEKDAKQAVKDFIFEKYSEFDFYQVESMDPEAMIILVLWKTEEGQTDEHPYLYFFKEGCIAEKV